MKLQPVVAIIVIAVGVIALVYEGISYTKTEQAIDLGPIQVSAVNTHTLPLAPLVGGIALLGGIMLLVMSGEKA